MPAMRQAPTVNRLLDSLPRGDMRRMLAGCETVELEFGDLICKSDQRISHVYFPTSSFISLIVAVDGSACLEVGLAGNEGMFGIPLILGVDTSPVLAVVQGAGSALRMDAATFIREIDRSKATHSALGRYIFVQLTQLAQTAACTRFHVVEARLARWLLMTQDRAHADTFHITQEYLAYMLGVRRVGVTKAAGALQARNLIRYARGAITILNRRGLKAAACGCYKADRESYDRIFH